MTNDTTKELKSGGLLKDKAWARWTALVLLAAAMFFAYIFMDILSPLQAALQSTQDWSPQAYGNYSGSETFLNVFIFFLIFAGIILDKMGVRFTAILSGAVMFVGGFINYYALTDSFQNSGLYNFMNDFVNLPNAWWNITPFYDGMPASAKLSAIGFMVFGCGCEMAGITVSRGIVKWFQGKEMALAMGTEMALARVGVAVVVIGSPLIAKFGGHLDVSRSVAVAALLLLIGLISFIAYAFMDKKLETEMGTNAEEKDDPFKISDLKYIFKSKVFWIVSLLCVLYYSAIFPFQKYAINMLQCNLGITAEQAGYIFFVFPLGAAAITPFLGKFIDKKGKGASMLIYGAMLMIVCHLTFAFILPAMRGSNMETITEDAIITASATELNPKNGENPVSTDIIFRPMHFANAKEAEIFRGKKIGEEVIFNPKNAYSDPKDYNAESTEEAIVNLFNDNEQVDFKKAHYLDGDFVVKITNIQAPAGFTGLAVAYLAIILLGISFSLVPASLWPSVPKLVDGKLLGSAYAVIFWIQNIGLYAFPKIIGNVLASTNEGVKNPIGYNYTAPMLIFACLGSIALILGVVLKALDAKHHYGLELPNRPSNETFEEEEYNVEILTAEA